MLSEDDGKYLLSVAKDAIETYVKENRKIDTPSDCPDYMHEELGVFVTLNKHNNLRGCIGYPEPVYPLIDAVIDSAISAAKVYSIIWTPSYRQRAYQRPPLPTSRFYINYLPSIRLRHHGLRPVPESKDCRQSSPSWTKDRKPVRFRQVQKLHEPKASSPPAKAEHTNRN